MSIKYITISIFLYLCLSAFIIDNTNYKVVYKVRYISHLDTKTVKTERAFLIIKNNQESSYTTENTYKQDSIKQLVREGILAAQEVMNDKYPKTGFNHFVQKNYKEQSLRIHNLIAIDNYIYNQKNELVWQLYPDTLKVQNYVCNKATTTYEGRDYIAWYTTEIPISDGPYKFWGLPGLIIKIYDTENHYTFTLESFEKYTGKSYSVPYQTRKTYEVTYDKFKTLSKEFTENPLKTLENIGMKGITVNGKDASQVKLPKRNPIERF